MEELKQRIGTIDMKTTWKPSTWAYTPKFEFVFYNNHSNDANMFISNVLDTNFEAKINNITSTFCLLI